MNEVRLPDKQKQPLRSETQSKEKANTRRPLTLTTQPCTFYIRDASITSGPPPEAGIRVRVRVALSPMSRKPARNQYGKTRQIVAYVLRASRSVSGSEKRGTSKEQPPFVGQDSQPRRIVFPSY